jgi:hypothetical protein
MIEIIKRAVTNQHDSVDYLCVSDSIFDLNGTQVYDLNIQVIYQCRKKRHISFLDRFVGTLIDARDVEPRHVVIPLSLSFSLVGHCNYFVTKNDCAWNEYVKKGKSSRSLSLTWLHFSLFLRAGIRRRRLVQVGEEPGAKVLVPFVPVDRR